MRAHAQPLARLFLTAALMFMLLAACTAPPGTGARTPLPAAMTPQPTASMAVAAATSSPMTPHPAASVAMSTASASPTLQPTPTQAPDITFVPASNTLGYDPRFSIAARQAEEVAVIVGFIRAYNQGRLEAALMFLDDAVQVSDCDYQAVGAVLFKGKPQVTRWLRQRLADHDQLRISRISNQNPDDELVAGIEYAHRTSTTLQRLGFADGITPKLGTKVVFTTDPVRIGAFANGPVGGDPNSCQP